MKMQILKSRWLLLLIGLFFLSSCAAQNQAKMVPDSMVKDLTPAFQAGGFESKVNGFVVLMDASSSMAEQYNGYRKFDIARAFVQRMNNTMPPITAVSGLRTIGHDSTLTRERTKLFYGMTPYDRAQLNDGLAAVTPAGGPTPLASGIDAIAGDLEQISGRKAVIIVSDGKDLEDDTLIAAQGLQETFKTDLCIYTVLVGDDEKGKVLMERIAQVSPCGQMVLAMETSPSGPMADYVSDVFLNRKDVGLGYHKPEPLLKDLGKLHFNFDSAALTEDGRKLLDQHIKALTVNPSLNILIQGHSSASGTEKYNQVLSEKRAATVKNYLINMGNIDSERLTTIGYGETKPAVVEADPKDKLSEQAKANMRVVFEIIE